jgi:hypothetical protein
MEELLRKFNLKSVALGFLVAFGTTGAFSQSYPSPHYNGMTVDQAPIFTSMNGYLYCNGSSPCTASTKLYSVGLGMLLSASYPPCISCVFSSGIFSYITSTPSGTQTASNAYYSPYTFQGDTSQVFPEYFYINNGVGMGANVPYINSLITPHWHEYTALTGSSGYITTITAPASIGNTSIAVANTDGLTVGLSYGFNDQVFTNPMTDVFTISSIVGNTVTFTPALAANHSSGDIISNSKRTQTAFQVDIATFMGYGDHYVFSAPSIISNCTPLAGQGDVYKTCTTGWSNGAVYAAQAGQYLEIDEWQLNDNGHDVAAIDNVHTLFRSVDTGARGAAWLGSFFNSAGTKAANAGMSIAGKWNVGYDATLGDFSSNGNAAFQMAPNHRVYFDSTVQNIYANPSGLYGNTLGSTWVGYVTSEGAWDLYVKNVAAMKCSSTPTCYFTNINLSGALYFFNVNTLSTDGINVYLKANSSGGMYFQPNGGVTELTVLSTGTTAVHNVSAPIHLSSVAAPVASTCGTGSAVDAGSSAQAGKFTIGSGATACTLTFAVAYPTNTYCTVTPAAQPAAVSNIPYISAQSKTAFTVSGGAASASYYYTCGGN